jgi:predicted O-linked N-acetylglucosamine transferase (SPINDLY family)
MHHYFRLHHAIDIALDSFPYAGGTTTCDALWMGVPTVSLVGAAPYARGGLSILSNLGLPHLAAGTPDEYVHAAVALAQDLPTLADLRRTMRDRMRASPLMNAPRFAGHVESCWRTLWQRWCAAT